MILIDTSAWIEFFRKNGNVNIKERVASLIDMNQAAYTCPIYFELLSGALPKEIPAIKEGLGFSEHINFIFSDWQCSADIEKKCRKKGLTIPRDDVFVAAVSFRSNIEIFTCDAHFKTMRDQGGIPLNLL